MNVALYVVTVAQCVYAASVGVGRVSVEGRRTCRLYCRVGIGFHLQIHEDGRVNGSHEPNHLSVLELFAISQGVIGIRGVYSNRFLAMNKRGRLHAMIHDNKAQTAVGDQQEECPSKLSLCDRLSPGKSPVMARESRAYGRQIET